MADIPNQPPTTPVSEPEMRNRNNIRHWCYNCNKRVAVETLANSPEIICRDCKLGFIELIPAIAFSPDDYDHNIENSDIHPSPGSQFLHILRLLAQSARDDPVPPPLPRTPSREGNVEDDDYLRLEFGGLDDDDDEDEDEEEDGDDDDDDDDDDHDHDEDEDDEEDENENEEIRGEEEGENRTNNNIEDEEEELRRRRDMLRLRIRELATRARSGRRNRILDWAELWMGIDDNPSDRYIGNPGDYVDEAGYEAFLMRLAESDSSGRKGAPPAAKSVVSELCKERIVAEEDTVVCAVCKDGVGIGELVTKLPCGHGYHGDCIVPWLEARNTCPVCRFELPTDDADYEEQRRKRVVGSSGGSSSSSSSFS